MVASNRTFRHALAVAALLAAATARRIDGVRSRQLQAAEAAGSPVLANMGDTVCGGSAIRQFLKTPETATEIRNIPWSQVEAVADDFLRTQSALVSRLQAEVDRLKAEIPLREKQEAVQPLAAAVIAQTVTAALGAQGSYGSLQMAKDTQCGAMRAKPKPTWTSSSAKAAATESFKARMVELLRDGKAAAPATTVRAECDKLLGAEGYCGEVCQGFAEAASAASTGTLAVTSKVDALRRELEKQTALLRTAVTEFDQCKQLKADLSVFRSQLQGLTEDVKDTHAKVMDAREALMDAQYELDDAEQSLQAQADATSKAVDLLQGAGTAAEAALSTFQTLSAQTESVRQSMTASSSQLDQAKLELTKAQSAADAVSGLKAAVSDSMLKMVMYFDEAVRVPIRDMGLGEKVNVDDLFPKSTSALESAGATGQSLAALSGFCGLPETQRVLSTSASKELCAIGDVAELQKDIDAAVTSRVGSLKDGLKEVQSWLCPYRGQTEEEVAAIPQLVQQGEPVGLREVISTFGKTPYYQQYLQHWKFKGKFLELYAALLAAVEQAKVTHSSATSKLQAVTAQLRESEQMMAAAQTALQQAVSDKAVAQGKRQEAETLLASMTAEKQTLRTTLDGLEAALAEAERRFKQAQTTLEAAHHEGVSLVQLFEEMEASWKA